jgi:hypothetical protein
MTADSDLNMVKPVDVSQNIVPLKGSDSKKQKKQQWRKPAKQNGPAESPEPETDLTNTGGDDRHLIDYRA